MKKKAIILVLGLVMIGLGWAIRSTFIIEDYWNKPIGGAMITIGVLVFSITFLSLFKNRKL